MADPTRVKSDKIRVLMDFDRTGTYSTKCGFNEDTITFGSALEETVMQDCDDPSAVPAVIRDKVSTTIGINGNGVVAVESAPKVVDAAHDPDSIPCKIEMEYPTEIVAYTGLMHVETAEIVRSGIRTATISTSMQSDGKFTKTTTPV